MFHPVDHPMERGWVGRIDGDNVIHLAAQTLQSFFTGGGSAREHAIYLRVETRLLAPVLHPPAVRIFADQGSFEFANPSAIVGPDAEIPSHQDPLVLLPRIAAVIGREGRVEGFTAFAEWRSVGLRAPKDRDFAFGLGPVVVTADELDPDGLEAAVAIDGSERLRGAFRDFDWELARDLAADRTVLKPGDLLVGPALGTVDGLGPGSSMTLELAGIGALTQIVAGD